MAGKRIGQFFVTMVPMFLMLAFEVVVMFVTMLIKAVAAVVNGEVSIDQIGVYVAGLSGKGDFLIVYMFVFHVLSILAFGLFYILSVNGKRVSNPFKRFSFKSIPSLAFLFIGLEMIVTCLLLVFGELFPEFISKYSNMIEQSGLADMTVFSTVVTLILAPVAEEFVFRGITMKLACRMTKKFWIANFIQAILFGVAHLNVVQGVYAFCLALILGYVVKKYNSLWASMIGHCLFNFSGTYLVAWVYGEESLVSVAKLVFVGMCSVILVLGGILMIRNDKKAASGAEMFKQEQAMIYKLANSPRVYAGATPPASNSTEQNGE